MRAHNFNKTQRKTTAAAETPDPELLLYNGEAPVEASELLEGEKAAYEALRKAKNDKANELDIAGYQARRDEEKETRV